MKTVTVTAAEKRRDNIIDLILGIGLPILQVILGKSAWSGFPQPIVHAICNIEFVVSYHNYSIFEDIGPIFSNALIIETVFLFSAWPIMIGCVSFFICGE